MKKNIIFRLVTFKKNLVVFLALIEREFKKCKNYKMGMFSCTLTKESLQKMTIHGDAAT
jgi:hypothetical protein